MHAIMYMLHVPTHTCTHARSHVRAQATRPGLTFPSTRDARTHDSRTHNTNTYDAQNRHCSGRRKPRRDPPTGYVPCLLAHPFPSPAALDTTPYRLRHRGPHHTAPLTAPHHYTSRLSTQAHDDGRTPAAQHHTAPQYPKHRTNVYSTPRVTRSVAYFMCM